MTMSDSDLVWMDLEMTGLDPDIERILEIATIATDSSLNILEEGPVLVIRQSEKLLASMDDWNHEHHTKSGLVDRVLADGITEAEAEAQTIEFISKYVGEQFIDNTSSNNRMLDDYLINHLRIIYNWKNKLFKQAKITLQINNLFDNEYVNNAWVYRFISDGYDPRSDDPYVNTDSERGYNMAGYFPQATRNYMLGITLGL